MTMGEELCCRLSASCPCSHNLAPSSHSFDNIFKPETSTHDTRRTARKIKWRARSRKSPTVRITPSPLWRRWKSTRAFRSSWWLFVVCGCVLCVVCCLLFVDRCSFLFLSYDFVVGCTSVHMALRISCLFGCFIFAHISFSMLLYFFFFFFFLFPHACTRIISSFFLFFSFFFMPRFTPGCFNPPPPYISVRLRGGQFCSKNPYFFCVI